MFCDISQFMNVTGPTYFGSKKNPRNSKLKFSKSHRIRDDKLSEKKSGYNIRIMDGKLIFNRIGEDWEYNLPLNDFL